MVVTILGAIGPPNSPPMALDLLSIRTIITRQASEQNKVTEKAKLSQKNNTS